MASSLFLATGFLFGGGDACRGAFCGQPQFVRAGLADLSALEIQQFAICQLGIAFGADGGLFAVLVVLRAVGTPVLSLMVLESLFADQILTADAAEL